MRTTGRLILWIVGLAGWFSPTLSAQGVGTPLIQHFSPKMYQAHPENWVIVQDNRGIIYVGNQSGVLEYDGSSWKLIEVPGASVKALGVSKEGVVYVGTSTDFGYLVPKSGGQLQYISLSKRLPADERYISPVNQLFCDSTGVYFCTSKKIYRYRGKTDFKIWSARDRFLTANYIQHTLFVQNQDGQLMELSADDLKPAPGGNAFLNLKIQSLLDYSGGSIIAVTEGHGLFVYSKTNIAGVLQPLKTTSDAWFKSAAITGAISSFNKEKKAYLYFISSQRGGIRMLNEQGDKQMQLDASNGFNQNSIASLYLDKQLSLWAMTGSGICQIGYNLPVSRFGSSQNINSTVWSVTRHEGKLYAGTGIGLFGWNELKKQFEQVLSIKSASRTLLSDGPDLYAGTSENIFRIRDQKLLQVLSTGGESVYALLRPKLHPELSYFAHFLPGISFKMI